MKICHITTVHPTKDVRIFYKECKSLARNGYDVKLVVINGESFVEDGVEVIGVPCRFRNRLQRITKAPKAAYQSAKKLNADLYHFHDPEFIPYASKLQKKGFRVIYDVHEDVPRQLLTKEYLPMWLRKMMAWAIEKYEDKKIRSFDGIITATSFIKERFKPLNHRATEIYNYPIPSQFDIREKWENKKNAICYIGRITRSRGIIELVKSLEHSETTLNLGGIIFPESLKEQIIRLESWKKVQEYGFVEREKVKEILAESKIGMVVLHPTRNYVDALPVKMFEYMMAGLPVISSNFPLWKEIIEKNNCGLCVNPLDAKEISDAVNFLLNNDETAKIMGENGKKTALKFFNWKTEEVKLLDHYSKLLVSID